MRVTVVAKKKGSYHAYRRDRYCPELEEGKVCCDGNLRGQADLGQQSA